jgi:hypothetical protein
MLMILTNVISLIEIGYIAKRLTQIGNIPISQAVSTFNYNIEKQFCFRSKYNSRNKVPNNLAQFTCSIRQSTVPESRREGQVAFDQKLCSQYHRSKRTAGFAEQIWRMRHPNNLRSSQTQTTVLLPSVTMQIGDRR